MRSVDVSGSSGSGPMGRRIGVRALVRGVWLLLIWMLLSGKPVRAQDGIRLSGGATLVFQDASDPDVKAEAVASVDLFGVFPLCDGLFEIYVEGNTTPRRGGVSTMIGEANTDAGTALDARRAGRIQISEMKLTWRLGGGARVTAGMLDVTGSLDVSRIANDENLHFLGVEFVNNPTIHFPDYALGGVVERRTQEGLGFAAVLTSSHGLADNPGVSYPQLLNLRQPGKGMFAAGSMRWNGRTARVGVGVWARTGEYARLDGQPGTESNRGLYTVVGARRGNHSISGRIGAANERVHLAHRFASLTYLWVRRPVAIGFGLAHTWASPDATDPATGDVNHLEGFVRGRLWRDLFITASGQLVHNSGFLRSSELLNREIFVSGVRFSYQF